MDGVEYVVGTEVLVLLVAEACAVTDMQSVCNAAVKDYGTECKATTDIAKFGAFGKHAQNCDGAFWNHMKRTRQLLDIEPMWVDLPMETDAGGGDLGRR